MKNIEAAKQHLQNTIKGATLKNGSIKENHKKIIKFLQDKVERIEKENKSLEIAANRECSNCIIDWKKCERYSEISEAGAFFCHEHRDKNED